MKRIGTSAIAALLLVAGTGSTAGAQETMMSERPVSRFDVGVYLGGSVTSRWYETRQFQVTTGQEATQTGDAQPYKIGYAPAVGALVNYWVTPRVGIRLHGAYMPSQVPFASDGFFDVFPDSLGDSERYILNNYVYDASLVFRPFILRPDVSMLLSSVYAFIGGGGWTTNVAGSGPGCEPTVLSHGACLPLDPEPATVGQGTAGAGINLFRLSDNLAIFGEVGAHVYDSPVHTGDSFLGGPATPADGAIVPVADDRYAVTTRVVAGLKLLLGDQLPPAPPPPPPPPPPVEEPAMQAISVCVVDGTQLRNVDAMYNPSTGDTMVMVAGQEQPFSQAYPSTTGYASGQSWFINSDPITFNRRRFVKFGLPRVVSAEQLTRSGEYQGVSVFTEAGAEAPFQVIYVPVRTGCEFQPYNAETEIRVRG